MYIYLDSKDLISLAEYKSTVDPTNFINNLYKIQSFLIFSMHNIMECSAPLFRTCNTSNVMKMLNTIERMPHIYLAEARIDLLELIEATSAFSEHREYMDVMPPFVNRFDYVISPFSKPETSIYFTYSLANILYDLWTVDINPFSGHAQLAARLQATLKINRDRSDYKRHKSNFQNCVLKNLRLYKIKFPESDVVKLSKWIYQSPKRCPALRLGYEVFHKILKNVTDKGEDSDIPDFIHISCLPYVDIMTLDNRMRGYIAQVDESLGINYSAKLYKNIEEIQAFLDSGSPPCA